MTDNTMCSINNVEELIRLKKLDEAKDALESFIGKPESCMSEKSNNMARVYNLLGLCYYKKVEFDEAKVHYSRAIELDEKLGAAYYNRGTVYYRMGEAEEAVRDMEKAVELEPGNEEFQLALRSAKLLRTK